MFTRFEIANMTYQWGGDREALQLLALRSQVLLLVECRTKSTPHARSGSVLPVGNILGPDWRALQNTRTSALGGSCIAVRRDAGITIRRHGLLHLSDGNSEVQARHARWAVLAIKGGPVIEMLAPHIPKESSGKQEQAERAVRQWLAGARHRRRESERKRLILIGGDVNQDVHKYGRELRMAHAFGIKPMAEYWSAGWGEAHPSTRRVANLDHEVLSITQGQR